MDSLQAFLDHSCHLHPAAETPLVAFVRAFRAWLPPADRATWTRSRIIGRLAELGLRLGTASDNTYHIMGCGCGRWVADPAGRMIHSV